MRTLSIEEIANMSTAELEQHILEVFTQPPTEAVLIQASRLVNLHLTVVYHHAVFIKWANAYDSQVHSPDWEDLVIESAKECRQYMRSRKN